MTLVVSTNVQEGCYRAVDSFGYLSIEYKINLDKKVGQ